MKKIIHYGAKGCCGGERGIKNDTRDGEDHLKYEQNTVGKNGKKGKYGRKMEGKEMMLQGRQKREDEFQVLRRQGKEDKDE